MPVYTDFDAAIADQPDLAALVAHFRPVARARLERGDDVVAVLEDLVTHPLAAATRPFGVRHLLALMRIFDLDLADAKAMGGWHGFGREGLSDDEMRRLFAGRRR